MRVIPLLVTTLLLAAPIFAQSPAPAPTQTTITADTPPAHPITPAQVHEMMELTGARRLKLQLMRSMMMNLRKAFPPYVPQDVIDDLEASTEKIDLEPMAVTAYQKHISTEDAAQVIAFYKSASGQRLIAVMPAIQQEMQLGGAKEGMSVAQEVIARHKDEIQAAAAKYKQEHSDAPKITSPN